MRNTPTPTKKSSWSVDVDAAKVLLLRLRLVLLLVLGQGGSDGRGQDAAVDVRRFQRQQHRPFGRRLRNARLVLFNNLCTK
jgi:hypothetical protein